MKKARRVQLIVTGLSASLFFSACSGDGAAPSSEGTTGGEALPAAELALVAYSTPQEAYDQITKAFSRTPKGRNVTFTKSYGGSGDQSRAVESGLTADIVAFSLEPDMTRLVKAGIVAPEWNAGEDKGLITKSVVVFGVRKGNPKRIKNWNDLTKKGIEVITPNPFTSGGARWNVMAAYGQAADGKSEAQGVEYLDKLFRNVPVQDDNARKSLQTFISGKGDVLLAYENEAIFAKSKRQNLDYVVPKSTILIENPIAITKTSKNQEQAKAFLDFLRGPQAQEILAKNGYRPTLEGTNSPNKFPVPESLFEITRFGSWAEVSKKFFDPRGSIMADVERKIGVSVG